MPMSAQTVFISSSHEDSQWVKRLLPHLAVLARDIDFEVWNHPRIGTGQWEEEISAAISRARVAVLLISADYFASDYIVKEEIPRLLERRNSGQLTLIPLILRPYPWQRFKWLQQAQVFPAGGIPLSHLSEAEIDRELAQLCNVVREAASVQSEEEEEPLDPADLPWLQVEKPDSAKRLVFISHAHVDGDFAELVKRRIEEEGFRAWIDVDRLLPGYDWRQGIDDGIRKSVALVAIVSPRSAGSEYVTYEWAFAYGAGVPVVPIVMELTKMHPRLDALQYLDFTNRRARPWDALIAALHDAVRTRKP